MALVNGLAEGAAVQAIMAVIDLVGELNKVKTQAGVVQVLRLHKGFLFVRVAAKIMIQRAAFVPIAVSASAQLTMRVENAARR
jgi:hypothetical protein